LGKLFSIWQDTGAVVHLADIVHPDIVDSLDIGANSTEEFRPGQTVPVKRKKERFICIKCRSGWVAFRQFYYGPKKVMSPTDFFNGYMSKHRLRKQFFVTSNRDSSWKGENN
jgi:hypothetical protein